MKNQLLVLVLGLLFHISYAQPKSDQELAAGFDKILSAAFKTNETGATALVARKGQVIYKKAFGMASIELGVPMKLDHVFRIGSITKQFTAVAILQLMEQGKLNLQDEITKFIPDYPTQNSKITIEHLLTHTSGIQSYTGMKDFIGRINMDLKPAEMIDHFKNQPMNFVPGTKWNYNNSGYFLLGYIIEKITGKTYPQYLEENFFKPLGMTNTLYGTDARIVKNRVAGYTRGDSGIENAHSMSMTQPYAAGSIQSTVEDLFKWHQAVFANKLVKNETLKKAHKKYVLSDGKETSYGYGWGLRYVQESPTIEHSGGINGFSTMAIYVPQEDVFVTVFSNCECISPGDITTKLAALALGKPYDYKAIPIETGDLKGYTGVYENAKSEQRIITLSENQLLSQRGKGPKFKIHAYQKDQFFFDDALLTIAFTRDAKRGVTALTTKGRDGSEVWNKTNKAIPVPVAIQVDPNILATYVGEYEITPTFLFVVTREKDRIFLQATGQEKVEMFAETTEKFFLKVNDAELQFVKDGSGKVTSVLLNQSGRDTEAKKVK
ncbi:MAG: serine hydrolase [Bacteroidota bacterium]